ncbi:MAG: right-handed parallel beta-helix repeat-containing protein [candidate division Zixibacteria bacterium]|nr:right-handed parallel beta-helix repeat-containing protein [candidate division Zixibacteria bacterium]
MSYLFCVLLLFISFLSSIQNSFAQTHKIWYVDNIKDKVIGDGTEENPIRDLQYAFDQAADGDTIFIFPGIYQAEPEEYIEELCGNCQEHKTRVNASKGFLIQGKGLNIIGSGKDRTILVTNAGYGVLLENSRNSLIADLKITGGKRDPDGNATDAGIVVKYSTVTIKDVEISDNIHQIDDVVVGIGGVFGRENSEIFILNNLIQNNGWDGVALYRGATAYMADNIICDGRGAGIGITWDAVATVYRNKISGYWKGIGTFGNSRAVVRNNLVHENLGWGVIATGTSYMDASNNVIIRNGNCGFAVWSLECRGICTNNIVTENGWRKEWVCPCVGVWATEINPNFSITYNDVWNNIAGNYKDMPDLTEQNGNLSVDPSFVSQNDFHLKSDSPLMDQGNPLLSDPDGTISDPGIYGGPNARR